MSGIRKAAIAAGSVLLILLAFAALFVGGVLFALRPVSAVETETVRLEIPAGTSVREVARKLKAQGLIRSELLFYAAARFSALTGRKDDFVLKSGSYTLSASQSIAELLEQLGSGQTAYIRTVFPEGLTLRKVAQLLAQDGVCDAATFYAAAHDAALLANYGIPAQSFEGYLFPDTYFFSPAMSGEAVVRMMVDNFFAHVATIAALTEKSDEELFAIVTLASIVEREYRVDREAPLIASVFANRLKADIGLYSCATIEYIITEIQGKPHPDVITYADLQLDSPYNTYKWRGLTPAPISNPGMVALSAAAAPSETDYYYFRLTDAAAGTHTFTKTFSAHAEAGATYHTKQAAVR